MIPRANFFGKAQKYTKSTEKQNTYEKFVTKKNPVSLAIWKKLIATWNELVLEQQKDGLVTVSCVFTAVDIAMFDVPAWQMLYEKLMCKANSIYAC